MDGPEPTEIGLGPEPGEMKFNGRWAIAMWLY